MTTAWSLLIASWLGVGAGIALALSTPSGDILALRVLIGFQLAFAGGIAGLWGLMRLRRASLAKRTYWLVLAWCFSGVAIIVIESQRSSQGAWPIVNGLVFAGVLTLVAGGGIGAVVTIRSIIEVVLLRRN